jgi:hypothetical protein
MFLAPLTNEYDDRDDRENKDRRHHDQYDVKLSCTLFHFVKLLVEEARRDQYSEAGSATILIKLELPLFILREK